MSLTVIECPVCGTPAQNYREAPRAWTSDRLWYTCPTCMTQSKVGDLKPIQKFTIARGDRRGHLSGGVVPMIGRMPLGTGSGTNSGTSFTALANAQIGGGETLVVFIAAESNGQLFTAITWNGNALTISPQSPAFSGGAADIQLVMAYLQNCPSGSGPITVTVDSSLAWWASVASRITLAAASSIDRTKTGSGSDASPTTGASAATTATNEILIGCIAWKTAAISGAWSNSFTAGQSASGTTGCLEEGFRIVTSKAAYTAAKTGATNVDWAAALLTFKQA